MSFADRIRKRRQKPLNVATPVNEIQRVLGLPMVRDGGGIVRDSAYYRRPDAPLYEGKPASLKQTQLYGLSAIGAGQGAVLSIGVGGGKTLISLLAHHEMPQTKRRVLLVPPALRVKTGNDYAQWNVYFHLDPNIDVIGYSDLSKMDGTNLLERLTIDQGYKEEEILIIADEAHELANFSAARTKRFVRFFEKHPGARFVAMSGTLYNRKLEDMAHLAEIALRGGSPIPYTGTGELSAWSECIATRGRPGDLDWATTAPLCDWAGHPISTSMGAKEKHQRCIDSFADRFQSTKGCFKPADDSPPMSLRFHIQTPTPPLPIQEALQRVREGFHVDSDEMYQSDALQVLDARRVALGCYYYLDWSLVGRRTPDTFWLERRAAWAAEVRSELESNAAEGYDSPGHVARRADICLERGNVYHLPQSLLNARADWLPIKDRYNLDDFRRTRWLDEYLVDWAVEWLKHQQGSAILWYGSKAFEGALRKKGVTVYGQGEEIPTKKAHPCAASYHVHGTGKNLQAWHKQAIIDVPSSGKKVEQLLGRTHRTGQKADVVETTFVIPTKEHLDALKSAIADARGVSSLMRQVQRLLIGDWVDDLPHKRDLI